MRRRSGRRLLLLLANLGHCVRFAGGPAPFAARVLRKLAAGDWRHAVAWLTMAVSYARRADATLYRDWLARQPRGADPDGEVLAVVAIAGVPENDLAGLLDLVAASRRPWRDLVVAAAPEQRRMVEARLGSDAGETAIVDADGSVPGALLAAMRTRLAAEPSRYRYVALLPAGAVPGDMPFSARGRTLLYGDEDRIDAAGVRSRPLFKPGFSPDLLCHADYLSSCLAMTAELALALPPPGSVEDMHSLALAAAEAAARVARVDAFTAHRYLPPPAARMPADLPDWLRRRYGGEASVGGGGGAWTCRFGSARRKVSIVIPTRDRIDLLGACVESIYGTGAGAFEVIVVDNGSIAPETGRWFDAARERWPSLRVLEAPGPFNWSRLNNLGMREAAGDVFLLLNNDTEALQAGWVERLADVALRHDVGAVGALLLYPDGGIQHAGVVTGFGGCADHIYVGTDPDAGDHMFVPPTVPRNVSAVTGACLAVARSTVEAIGPLDENYRVTGSDVEFCLRALDAGRVNVYLPDVRLIHHESQSRTGRDPEADVERLRALIAKRPPDPYFNPKLSMVSLYPSYPL